jgi:hypothetical protein
MLPKGSSLLQPTTAIRKIELSLFVAERAAETAAFKRVSARRAATGA